MRDSTTIFDQESDARAEAEADLTQEFWGDSSGWASTARTSRTSSDRQSAFQLPSSDAPTSSFRLDHTPASMKAIRDGIAAFRPKRRWRDDSTGPVERTREHGVVRAEAVAEPPASSAAIASAPRRPSPERLAHRDATIADLAAGRYDGAPYPRTSSIDAPVDAAPDPESDEDLIALTPTTAPDRLLGSVDPRVVRITLVVIAIVLAIPLALALRDDSSTVRTETEPGATVIDPSEGTDAQPDGAAPVQAPDAAGATPDAADGSASVTDRDGSTGAPTMPAADASVEPASEAPTAVLTEAEVEASPSSSAATTESVVAESVDAGAGVTAATVTEPAEREVPDCSHNYTAGAGDSWYRIADEAGVTPAALLEQNRATLDTVIFPGGEICLPAGATVPSPPTTVAATTAPTTAAPTTAAPTTAAPTTTAAPAPQPSYTRDEVQALISETWPADQVDKALEIARRESNFIATADNGWCCVGVFQLYWSVHQGWLDDHGIHTRDDLKDARKNIAAAYALYERSGGWGPWGG